MNNFITSLALSAALLATAGTAFAQTDDHSHHHPAPASASTSAPSSAASSANPDDAKTWTEGEVRKVDKATGKLTLRHGPIVQLDMAAMTMVFQVADPQWLESLKVGDKLWFKVERRTSGLVVTGVKGR